MICYPENITCNPGATYGGLIDTLQIVPVEIVKDVPICCGKNDFLTTDLLEVYGILSELPYYKFSDKAASYSFKSKSGIRGDIWEIEVLITLNQIRNELQRELQKLIGQKFILVFGDANGNKFLGGTKSQPMRVSIEGTTGDARSAGNSAQIVFRSKQKTLPCILDASIADDPLSNLGDLPPVVSLDNGGQFTRLPAGGFQTNGLIRQASGVTAQAPASNLSLSLSFDNISAGSVLAAPAIFDYTNDINLATAVPTGDGAQNYVTNLQPYITGGTGTFSNAGNPGNITVNFDKDGFATANNLTDESASEIRMSVRAISGKNQGNLVQSTIPTFVDDVYRVAIRKATVTSASSGAGFSHDRISVTFDIDENDEYNQGSPTNLFWAMDVRSVELSTANSYTGAELTDPINDTSPPNPGNAGISRVVGDFSSVDIDLTGNGPNAVTLILRTSGNGQYAGGIAWNFMYLLITDLDTPPEVFSIELQAPYWTLDDDTIELNIGLVVPASLQLASAILDFSATSGMAEITLGNSSPLSGQNINKVLVPATAISARQHRITMTAPWPTNPSITLASDIIFNITALKK